MKKIVDYFMFFNEKELLELRLNLLKDHVDEFVISELNYTHSGAKKEFTCKKVLEEIGFANNDRIKVIELNIEGMSLVPNELDIVNSAEANSLKEVYAWTRERLQRDALMRLIYSEEYSNDTVFIMGDCDEIINPKFIDYFASVCRNHKKNIIKIPLVLLEGDAESRLYEGRNPVPWMHSLLMCTAQQLRDGGTPTKMRSNVLNEYPPVWITENGYTIQDCGWHFTWMGNSERKKEKADSFIHYSNMDCVNTLSVNSVKELCPDDKNRHKYQKRTYPLQFLPKVIFSLPRVKEFLLPQQKQEEEEVIETTKSVSSSKNFVQHVMEAGGKITPIIIPAELTNGTGTFNPSVYNDNGQLMAVVRHCQVTIFHAEKGVFEHEWGPLIYLHPENDWTLTTTNYLVLFNDDMTTKKVHKIDMSRFHVKPEWNFIGLEDCRIFRWEGKLYICGVRRDTTPNGEGRMELSEIIITDDSVEEVSRYRIPVLEGVYSYCEKNWMPIVDVPYHFVKWCTETEVVKVDIENKKTIQTALTNNAHIGFTKDPRGSSHVLPWKNGYFCIIHEVDLFQSLAGRKNGKYRHRFIFWDKNWNIIKKSHEFFFLGGEIEFCAGMTKKDDDYLISFGFQDNCAFVLTCPEKIIEDIFNDAS